MADAIVISLKLASIQLVDTRRAFMIPKMNTQSVILMSK